MLSNVDKQQYDVVLKDTIVDDLFTAPHYAFSSLLIDGHQCSLALIASLLAHEMIHQFNFECEDEGKIEWLDIACGRTYDMHGKNFERWMNIANSKFGLFVQKSAYGTIRGLSHDTVEVIKKFADGDYDINESDKKEHMNGHKILKHTIDFSAIVQFN